MVLNPYLAVLIAATIGASSGIFIKLLALPTTSFAFFRTAIPVSVLLLYFSWKKVKLFQGNYKLLLLVSAINTLNYFLYVFAYQHIGIGKAVIILFTWPIFGVIFSRIILKEKISRFASLLIAMAFIGVVIMNFSKDMGLSDQDFIGAIAMLAAAIVTGLVTVMFKKELKTYSTAEMIFYQNIVGAVLFLPFMFFSPLPTFMQASMAALYGFLIGIIAFIFFFLGLKKLKLTHYSLLCYWEVPAALIFSVLFFKEAITFSMVIGGALIIISGLLLKKEKVVVAE